MTPASVLVSALEPVLIIDKDQYTKIGICFMC